MEIRAEILGDLVRPGICFYAQDLKRPTPRPIASKDVSLIAVFARADGAVIFGNQRTMTPESLGEPDKAEGLTVPVVFARPTPQKPF